MRPIINKQQNGSRFADLVRARIETEKQFRQLDTLEASKLSAPAFLKAAMRLASTTEPRLKELREKLKLDEQSSFGLSEVAQARRRMSASIRSRNFSGPPSELRRWNFCITPTAIAELAVLRSSTFELAAVAVMDTVETHPEVFGTNESLPDHYRRIADLRLRLDELDAQIAEGYTAADLIIDDKGMAYFALSGGKVPVGPKASAGERLINFLIAEEQKPPTSPTEEVRSAPRPSVRRVEGLG